MGQSNAAERAGDHDHRLWRRGYPASALERGAETLLTKPIDFAALRAEIDTRAGCLTPARAYPIAAMHFGR